MTSTVQNLQTQLATCRTSQEIRRVINDFCAQFGTIVNATLLCGKPVTGQTLCVVDFARENAQTNLCANTLDGQVFGFNSVVFKFPTHPDFGCVKGFPADSPSCSCIART